MTLLILLSIKVAILFTCMCASGLCLVCVFGFDFCITFWGWMNRWGHNICVGMEFTLPSFYAFLFSPSNFLSRNHKFWQPKSMKPHIHIFQIWCSTTDVLWLTITQYNGNVAKTIIIITLGFSISYKQKIILKIVYRCPWKNY